MLNRRVTQRTPHRAAEYLIVCGPVPGHKEAEGSEGVDPAPDGFSAGIKKAAPKSRLQVARMLLGFLGGLGRVALAGFARYRVVDLADIVSLVRERLVLHAISRVRLGLDLAFNDHRRPGLEGGGELRQRAPNLNLEPIGVLVPS